MIHYQFQLNNSHFTLDYQQISFDCETPADYPWNFVVTYFLSKVQLCLQVQKKYKINQCLVRVFNQIKWRKWWPNL